MAAIDRLLDDIAREASRIVRDAEQARRHREVPLPGGAGVSPPDDVAASKIDAFPQASSIGDLGPAVQAHARPELGGPAPPRAELFAQSSVPILPAGHCQPEPEPRTDDRPSRPLHRAEQLARRVIDRLGVGALARLFGWSR
jgi:hypothetical protein